MVAKTQGTERRVEILDLDLARARMRGRRSEAPRPPYSSLVSLLTMAINSPSTLPSVAGSLLAIPAFGPWFEAAAMNSSHATQTMRALHSPTHHVLVL